MNYHYLLFLFELKILISNEFFLVHVAFYSVFDIVIGFKYLVAISSLF